MSEVFICRCKKITEYDIVVAIKNGARTFSEVQKSTGLGTGCGTCISKATDIFEILLKENK